MHEALALGRCVQIALAVFPVRHRGSRFHRVMRCARGHEGLVQDDARFGKARVDVAIRPFGAGFAHWQLAFARGREVFLGPLPLLNLTRYDRVPVRARVGAARSQALERIHTEGQRLEVEHDRVDRVLGDGFGDRGHGQDRLADEVRLVGQNVIGWAGLLRNFVRPQDGHDSVHRERRGGVDAPNTTVRHRALEQAAEEHAVPAEVLCVFRATRHLSVDVGWCVVLSQ